MTKQEIIQTLLGILGVGILGMISFTVKYLKDIASNLSELNIKIAVMINNHDNLEKRVEHLEEKVED